MLLIINNSNGIFIIITIITIIAIITIIILSLRGDRKAKYPWILGRPPGHCTGNKLSTKLSAEIGVLLCFLWFCCSFMRSESFSVVLTHMNIQWLILQWGMELKHLEPNFPFSLCKNKCDLGFHRSRRNFSNISPCHLSPASREDRTFASVLTRKLPWGNC